MKPIAISVLTVCGVEELPEHAASKVTHVLTLIDPGWPDIEAFDTFDDHHRKIMRFHDIIDPAEGKVMPTPEHVAEILEFGEELAASREAREDGHLLVHCYMGVSRSTAAMLSLLAQVHPEESEERLFERLQEIRPRAWPNSLMVGYADEQLGRGGRLVEALKRHYGWQLKRDPRFYDWMDQLGRQREIDMAVG
ncbi:tyrosine phosphatase family protein [Pelagibius marinus]|uniref:tyrosine phosphatase family protein n=1 Tax=Pelagibius marinus TaxID=2762760 RepID=UPI001872E533|nr:protein-tyrosine-phosphatase [Pelagibius marinus]